MNPKRFPSWKSAFGLWTLFLVACGSSGSLEDPKQNLASQFKAKDEIRPSWTWSQPGLPVLLSLDDLGEPELMWSVREKDRGSYRRSSMRSLQQRPALILAGPAGVREVRFSPSGSTILVQEFAVGFDRSQVVIFRRDSRTGAWSSRLIALEEVVVPKMRTLDDGSRAPERLNRSDPPRILRLDDGQVIYELEGKSHSKVF